jgi:protein phosphatase
LADGMGGLQHGRAASSLAVKTVLEAYEAKTVDESIPQALERALHAGNNAVLAFAASTGAAGDVGATLIAAVLHDSGLQWVSVGDSGLFLFRERSLSMLNTPHVYANELDAHAAAGKISQEEALHDPQRQALTSYLGLRGLSEIDRSVRPFPLQPGDRVVLASDGLFKAITTGEIVAELGSDPQSACEALVQKALSKNIKHQDNITVLSVDPFPSPPKLVEPPQTGTRLWPSLIGIALVALIAAGAWRFTRTTKSPDAASPASAAAPAASPDYVKIPAGGFDDGIRKIRITHEFEIMKGEGPDKMSYAALAAVVKRLNDQKDGFVYRLPTEAEWELAVHAGVLEGIDDETQEWCRDWFDEKYLLSAPDADPPGPASGTARVVRGPSSRIGKAPDTNDSEIGYRLVRTPR